MYHYIWIEGESNLNEFCMRRFGDRPHFMETIGKVHGKHASAKVHLIYKYLTDEEIAQGKGGSHEMYFLYMEDKNGKHSWSELERIMRWPYEEIRTDKTAILRR